MPYKLFITLQKHLKIKNKTKQIGSKIGRKSAKSKWIFNSTSIKLNTVSTSQVQFNT